MVSLIQFIKQTRSNMRVQMKNNFFRPLIDTILVNSQGEVRVYRHTTCFFVDLRHMEAPQGKTGIADPPSTFRENSIDGIFFAQVGDFKQLSRGPWWPKSISEQSDRRSLTSSTTWLYQFFFNYCEFFKCVYKHAFSPYGFPKTPSP